MRTDIGTDIDEQSSPTWCLPGLAKESACSTDVIRLELSGLLQDVADTVGLGWNQEVTSVGRDEFHRLVGGLIHETTSARTTMSVVANTPWM